MVSMLALSDEVGFEIRSFHHALEAYKIRDELVRRKISVSTWADWWGFKLEAFDGIQENLALVELSGGIPIVHTDSSEGIQRMNQEAAKGIYSGRHAGLAIDEARAMRWVTMNPAWALGIERRVGTLEVGKDADVVIWSGDPLSVYTRAELVLIDGAERWSLARDGKGEKRWSDFEVVP
jgi:imidazolonepropionase-like amidohydrolase